MSNVVSSCHGFSVFAGPYERTVFGTSFAILSKHRDEEEELFSSLDAPAKEGRTRAFFGGHGGYA